MATFKEYIKPILDSYKRKMLSDYLICLPVYNSNKVIAFLRPITADYIVTMPDCVSLLSRWRVENPTISTGIFQVTDDRTKKWLDNLVINNDDRIIFMIQDINGAYLGHIGYASFEEEDNSAEIDSVLRGVKNYIPGLMHFSMQTIIQWGFDKLRLKKIHLKVFYDNKHAIEFYRKCGFVDSIKIPLILVEMPNEKKWEIDSNTFNQNAERFYLRMVYKS